jgi:pimeloyl-ACP methyl ester carboxylesterase
MAQRPQLSPSIYDDRGTGTPLMLLHGFPLDRRVWTHQLTGLSGRMRVIAPDLRGFGRHSNATAFTLDDLADDVKGLIDQLGLPKVVLGGLSMGGYVVGAFAAKYPQALKGMLLIDTKAEADTAEGRTGRDKMIALVREQGSAAVAEQMLPKMVAPRALAQDAPVVAELKAMMAACPADTIAFALAAMRERPDRTIDLARAAVPTLVIVGEHDAIISPAVARTMARQIAVAAVCEVPGAGHMSPLEAPQAVNDAIARFVGGLV